jgi:hypothetical protein
MRTAPRFAAASVAIGAALSSLGGLSAPAQAADLHYAVTAHKVVVNQSYENIPWSIAGAGSANVDIADATLEHIATRDDADYDYSDAAPPHGTFKFYDWERMGKYEVYGEADDYDYNDMGAAPAYLTIKRASKSSVSATRSGVYVTVRAVTRKYTGGYPLWPAHRNATVRYQRYAAGAWHTLGSRIVPSNGVTTFRTAKAVAAKYRVVALETGTVWGSTSAAVTR